jgi:lipoate-protein ligase A
MLCIKNPYTDPYFNLAAEEYLLKNFKEDIIMVWQNEPSIILGKHQNVRAEVNLDFVKEKQIKVVRRYSGGGAVYHDLGNVNLTFIENNSTLDFDKFTNLTISILASLGISAQADARRALNIDGLKISGSAQSVHKNRVLYHATLLYSSDLTILNESLDSKFQAPDDKPSRFYVKSVKSVVTNISEHLSTEISIENFKQSILDYFLENKEDNKLYSFDKEDLAAIELLKEKKYATAVWNYND